MTRGIGMLAVFLLLLQPAPTEGRRYVTGTKLVEDDDPDPESMLSEVGERDISSLLSDMHSPPQVDSDIDNAFEVPQEAPSVLQQVGERDVASLLSELHSPSRVSIDNNNAFEDPQVARNMLPQKGDPDPASTLAEVGERDISSLLEDMHADFQKHRVQPQWAFVQMNGTQKIVQSRKSTCCCKKDWAYLAKIKLYDAEHPEGGIEHSSIKGHGIRVVDATGDGAKVTFYLPFHGWHGREVKNKTVTTPAAKCRGKGSRNFFEAEFDVNAFDMTDATYMHFYAKNCVLKESFMGGCSMRDGREEKPARMCEVEGSLPYSIPRLCGDSEENDNSQ